MGVLFFNWLFRSCCRWLARWELLECVRTTWNWRFIGTSLLLFWQASQVWLSCESSGDFEWHQFLCVVSVVFLIWSLYVFNSGKCVKVWLSLCCSLMPFCEIGCVEGLAWDLVERWLLAHLVLYTAACHHDHLATQQQYGQVNIMLLSIQCVCETSDETITQSVCLPIDPSTVPDIDNTAMYLHAYFTSVSSHVLCSPDYNSGYHHIRLVSPTISSNVLLRNADYYKRIPWWTSVNHVTCNHCGKTDTYAGGSANMWSTLNNHIQCRLVKEMR